RSRLTPVFMSTDLVAALEEAGAWSALEAVLAEGATLSRAAAAWALTATGRGGESAAEAATADLLEGDRGTFRATDPRLRAVVATIVRAGDARRRRLEAGLAALPHPHRLALADALARATPRSDAGSRVVEDALRAAGRARVSSRRSATPEA